MGNVFNANRMSGALNKLLKRTVAFLSGTALMFTSSAISYSTVMAHANDDYSSHEQNNVESLEPVTNLRWLTLPYGDSNTAIWDSVEGANYYSVTVSLYDCNDESLIGYAETGTNETKLDVQQEIHSIADGNYSKLWAYYVVTVVSQKIINGNIVAESIGVSRRNTCRTNILPKLPTPTDLTLTETGLLSFNYGGRDCENVNFIVNYYLKNPKNDSYILAGAIYDWWDDAISNCSRSNNSFCLKIDFEKKNSDLNRAYLEMCQKGYCNPGDQALLYVNIFPYDRLGYLDGDCSDCSNPIPYLPNIPELLPTPANVTLSSQRVLSFSYDESVLQSQFSYIHCLITYEHDNKCFEIKDHFELDKFDFKDGYYYYQLPFYHGFEYDLFNDEFCNPGDIINLSVEYIYIESYSFENYCYHYSRYSEQSETIEYQTGNIQLLPSLTDMTLANNSTLSFKFNGPIDDDLKFAGSYYLTNPKNNKSMWAGSLIFSIKDCTINDGVYYIKLDEDEFKDNQNRSFYKMGGYRISSTAYNTFEFERGFTDLCNMGCCDPHDSVLLSLKIHPYYENNIKGLSSECVSSIEYKLYNNVDAINITPNNPIIYKDRSYYLGKTILPIGATYGTIDWTSSDESIVTVDSTGKITGVSVGTANVTAKIGDVSATVPVTVYEHESLGETLNHDATGHEYETVWSWSDNFDSCTALIKCKNCHFKSEKITASISKIDDESYAAACETAGQNKYIAEINYNGQIFNDTKVQTLDALGHANTVISWNWSGDHTSCTANLKCSRCGDESTVVITDIAHEHVAPTAEHDGYDRYTASIEIDGQTYSDTADIPISADAIKDVNAKILNTIKGNIQGELGDAIEETRAAYDALPDEQKGCIDANNYSAFVVIERLYLDNRKIKSDSDEAIQNISRDLEDALADAEDAQQKAADAQNAKMQAEEELQNVRHDLEQAEAEKDDAEAKLNQALEDKNAATAEAEQALKDKNAAEERALQAEADKTDAESRAEQATKDKADAEAKFNKALEDKNAATAEAEQALKDKNAAEEKALQAEADKADAESRAEQATKDKADAEAKLNKALEDKNAATAEAEQALKDKDAAEEKALQAEKDKIEADARAEQAEADKAEAEMKAEQAEAEKVAAEARAIQAEFEKEEAEASAEQANADKAEAEAKVAKALEDKEAAEKFAEEQRMAAENALAKYEEQKVLAEKAAEKLDALTQENAALKEKADSLAEDNESLKSEIEKLRTENESLQTEKEKLESENEALQAEKEKLESENEALQAEKEKLDADNEALQSDNERLGIDNVALQTENERLGIDNAALQTENERLGIDNAALQTENERLGMENETLQTENERLGTDNETLQYENAKLEADNADLQAEIKRLNAEIEALKAEIAELRAEIDALKAEIAGLNAEIEALRAENESLKAENAVLRAENEEIFMSDKAVESALKEARNDLDKANKELDKAEKEKAKAEEKLRKAEQNHSDSEDKLNKARADLEEAEARLINATAGKEAAEARISELLDIIEKQDSTARQALADKKAAEARARQAEADLADAEARASQAEADKAAAEAMAEQAKTDKVTAEESANQAEAERANAEARAEKAEAEKATAEAIAGKVLEEKAASEAVLDQIRAEIKSAEEVLDELKSENESLAEENAALKAEAAEVSELIAEIGNVELTEKCRDSILAARTAYEKLTYGQKTLVLNSVDLVVAEKTYELLELSANDAIEGNETSEPEANTETDIPENAEESSDPQTADDEHSEPEIPDNITVPEPETPSDDVPEEIISEQNNEDENETPQISEASLSDVDVEKFIEEILPQTGVTGSRSMYVFALIMIVAGAYMIRKSKKKCKTDGTGG